MKISIIGYGNIGKTFTQSFINSGVVKAADIKVLCKRPPLILNNAVPLDNFETDAKKAVEGSDVVILAVKPQDFPALAQNLNGIFQKDQIVLSVMAGVKMASLASLTGASKIVRSIPNVAAQIGMGMTVFTASESISRDELMAVQNLLNTTGKSLYVSKEAMIDAATAISGSGPAYVFYVMDAMMAAARNLGFSASEAETLVNQTFIGAINLQNGSSLDSAGWISKVASKGGTTERALAVFDNSGLPLILEKAIVEAERRARELGT